MIEDHIAQVKINGTQSEDELYQSMQLFRGVIEFAQRQNSFNATPLIPFNVAVQMPDFYAETQNMSDQLARDPHFKSAFMALNAGEYPLHEVQVDEKTNMLNMSPSALWFCRLYTQLKAVDIKPKLRENQIIAYLQKLAGLRSEDKADIIGKYLKTDLDTKGVSNLIYQLRHRLPEIINENPDIGLSIQLYNQAIIIDRTELQNVQTVADD